MKSVILASGIAVALAILDPIGSSAQQGAAPPPATAAKPAPDLKGPAPKFPDGTPDISGVWLGGGPTGDIEDGLAEGEEIPLLPEARKIKESRMAKDDPEANCLPTGIPRIAPYPWRIIQIPNYIYFLFEGNIHSYRQIFMDGRPHPEGDALNPTWYGHSTGRWEGDTLVVDTVGFNDRFWFDFVGHPHTEKLHTIERYTRKDYGTLVNEVTIDDPGAYSRPFHLLFTARLRPGEDLMEYICQENERSTDRMQGPALRDVPRRNPRPKPWR